MSTNYLQLIKSINTPQPPPGRTEQPLTAQQGRDGLHPYAAAAVAAELDRLDRLPRPWTAGSYWDQTTFEVACNLLEIAHSPWSGYSPADAETDLRARAPRDERWGVRQHDKCWRSAIDRVAGAGRPEPDPGATIPPVTTIDGPSEAQLTDFWAARPELTHLHTYARARRVSPWAVLACTLARVATATPYIVGLPPTVGGRASLNLFVGLVGRSGTGKGAAEAVAADAYRVGYIETHRIGSGEGIAHGYMQRTRGGGVEWRDDTHAVLFTVPEIDTMAALGDRKGATLMPELRSAWSGERLGFGYADPTKRLPVPAHEYRMALICGIQPHRAAYILDDADGGTPQRFLWMPATDPDAPDLPPAAPQPLDWVMPPLPTLRNAHGGVDITVCDTARRLIDTAALARHRGQVDALDGHALLSRLKVAAILGIMQERWTVTDEDWDLAGIILGVSDHVRGRVAQALRSKAHESNLARADAEASRVIHVTDKVANAAAKRVCGVVLRKLRAAPDGLSGSELRRAVASRDRANFVEALDRLIEAGQVVQDESKYRAKEET